MDELTELEKEFKQKIEQLMLSENWLIDELKEEDRNSIAKAAASLCREKIRRAIRLQAIIPGDGEYSPTFKYTESEILEKLKL